ncbi:MAG TPA: type I-E CRISPR-associated protein Cas7/Cse4/CasC [Candidatus Paceibacterota bacterium]|nr:type I-E CRISPR-associated protein Cas7/Cse4/CasC [Verrucomicrobiota bacterium]HRY49789.1 type I-E CRISPR-associated protein Cas7/Cse4/CasC [Candidatus Paceibacterota bacterium]
MKLIELHILQSFPVSCLNRDDVGSPKTAVFGGVNRARLSSQSLKRPIRLALQEQAPSIFAGERSKLIIIPLADRIEKIGVERERALELARATGAYLATLDEKAAAKGVEKVKTLMFLSPAELDSIAKDLAHASKAAPPAASQPDESGAKIKKKGDSSLDVGKIAAKACNNVALKDAADIALFGRMVASDHSITVEGAAMFGHALSTHKADNDLDFFTAVDDRQKEDPTVGEEDRTGSGMMGTLEFSSAVYYRYVALNLDQLFYQTDRDGKPSANLSSLLGADHLSIRQKIVDAFIRATLMTVPGARKNSMNAHTLPGCVIGTFKSAGQPVQLINAFETPVRPKSGLMNASIEALKAHHAQLKETWGIACDEEVILPNKNLNAFCEALTKHVS